MTTINPLDETRIQYQKWMKRMCDDPTGREVIGESLGLQIKKVDGPEGKYAVAVLVPSYRGLHPKMMDSSTAMIRYAQKFFTVMSEPVQGSSLISWVRNDMYARLLKSGKPFTHVLYMDDDMVMENDYLVRMIERQRDVVGCVYTHRTDPPVPNMHLVELETCVARRVLDWKVQRGIALDDGMISAENPKSTLAVGTGLLLVKKEVMDRVGEFYRNCEYEAKLWNLSEEQTLRARQKRSEACEATGNSFWFQLLARMDGWGESGEDSSFSIKAAMCGFKVYVDTTIQPGHVGEYTYSHADFLQFRQQEVDKATARGLYDVKESEVMV